jgi:hypothetical protein
MKNVPWPTPLSGRGHKALLLHLNLGGFPGSSVLTLARQFQVVVLSSKRRKDSTIIGKFVPFRHKEVSANLQAVSG